MTSYTLKHKPWKRRLTLRVDTVGGVIVTASKSARTQDIESFIAQNTRWIERRQEAARKLLEAYPPKIFEPGEAEHFRREQSEKTRQACEEAARRWAPLLGIENFTVQAARQKSRWGSCSHSGKLRFNWRLSLAPTAILDYVVIHELCHLKHMNHSPKFWALVASLCPGYAERRRRLRTHGEGLMLQYPD